MTSAKSVKSSSRSATGVKHITGISKIISSNKENSSKTIEATQERAKGSSQAGAMALKKVLEKGAALISSSETSSESVAASNELKTAQKIQTVSRQTNVLKSSSTMESNASSEYSSKTMSKASHGGSSKIYGGRTTMVVTLHPNLGEQHRLCSFKEKKVFSSLLPFDSLIPLCGPPSKAFCILWKQQY